MAASGKKVKKNKWKSIDVAAILPDSHPGLAKATSSMWADEVDDNERELQMAVKAISQLPTAPRSARGSDDERVPKSPPYVAYITNIPFEVIEEDIAEFFGDLQIDNIRLPKNDGTGKLKGYGYVEFTERNGLIDALRISDTTLKGRRIRIDVSESNDRGRMDRMGRDRMGMGLGRDRDDDPDRTSGDWRSGPRVEPQGEERDRYQGRSSGGGGFGGGGFRDREGREGDREGRDRGGFGAPRETDTREGGWREGMGSGTADRFGDRDRDRDSYRSRDNFGDRDRGFGERRGFGDRDRDDRDRGGRFGDREGYGDRPRYGDRDRDGPQRRYGEDDQDRDRYQRREESSAESSEPKARPKLQLQPRTKPVENPPPAPVEDEKEEAPAAPVAAAPPVPKASIFGAAKPVDTAAREREIEERLNKAKDRPKDSKEGDDSRSKEGSEHGDGAAPAATAEAAPPPKVNAWTRRPRIEPSSSNGDSERNDNYDRRAASPNDGDRRTNDDRDDYRNRRGGYGYGRDRRDNDSRDNESNRYQDSDRGGYRDEGRGGSQDRRDGYARDGDHGRSKDDGGSADRDRYERGEGRDRGGPHGRGMGRGKGQGHSRGERDGGGSKVKSSDRPPRKEHSDNNDQPRMPKYEEQQTPNFAGSNKYAHLNEDDDRDGVPED